MKNIIFIEGVSGVGKSTTVHRLNEKLCSLGYTVRYHIEGDSDSPLDLCWIAYLTIAEYENLLLSYPMFAPEFSKNIIFQGDYILLRYQVGRTRIYSQEINNELHHRELCYNPTNVEPLSKFTEVFFNLWKRFGESDNNFDFEIFDASLVSHMTNDLIRNYNASEDEIARHLNALLRNIEHFNPIIFYLSTDNVLERLIKARKSHGQIPLTDKQIKFWEKRKNIDLSVLPRLSIKPHIIDISKENWDFAINDIVSKLMKI